MELESSVGIFNDFVMRRFLFCFIALFPATAFAWGGDGHQITCLIAEDHLTPEAKAGIHDLLGKDVNISDAEIASWADNERREKRSTSPWHFVDIPTTADKFDEARDGDHGNNVIDAINKFEKVLTDKKASKDDRAEALKYIVHLVGDAHQPLHCADRNGDKGGNGRLVFFPGRKAAQNLHTCWDSLILIRHKSPMRDMDYSDKLNKSITPDQLAKWQAGTPEDWANESHKLAIDMAYKDIPADGPPPALDQKYLDAAGVCIDEQLEKGGVRLAMILNRDFGR